MPQNPPQCETVAGKAAAVVELLDALQERDPEAFPRDPLPPSQLRALRAIERSEGINVCALAKILGTRPPAASRLCDRMEADGLIQRTPSTSSRREVELRLSPRTRRLLADVRSAHLRELREVVQKLPPETLTGLSVHLGRLRSAIEQRLGTPPAGGDHRTGVA